MTDEQRQILDLALFDLSSDSGVRWSGEFMAEVAAALRALLDENDRLRADIATVWRERSEFAKRIDEADADLAQRTAERDEARREICDRISAYAPSMSAKQIAKERGWDCFKEAKP
jgi:hypothetical protein